MKMTTVYLSSTDEKRLNRIRELRYPNQEVSDEKLIKSAISAYWAACELQKANTLQEADADRRLREENMGITDSWREYND